MVIISCCQFDVPITRVLSSSLLEQSYGGNYGYKKSNNVISKWILFFCYLFKMFILCSISLSYFFVISFVVFIKQVRSCSQASNIHHVNSIFSFVLFLIPYLHKFHSMFILLCMDNIFCEMLCTHALAENLKVCCNSN